MRHSVTLPLNKSFGKQDLFFCMEKHLKIIFGNKSENLFYAYLKLIDERH